MNHDLRVDLAVERVSGDLYRLRNNGEDAAENVIAHDLPDSVYHFPQGETVEPHDFTENFLIAPHVGGDKAPANVWVSWEGQSDPVRLSVPS